MVAFRFFLAPVRLLTFRACATRELDDDASMSLVFEYMVDAVLL